MARISCERAKVAPTRGWVYQKADKVPAQYTRSQKGCTCIHMQFMACMCANIDCVKGQDMNSTVRLRWRSLLQRSIPRSFNVILSLI